MEFFDVSFGRSAEELSGLVTKFDKFDLNTKLVALTYNGAAVMSGELNRLQSKTKSVAPQASVTHCYAYAFNLVLSRACNSIQSEFSLQICQDFPHIFQNLRAHQCLKRKKLCIIYI